MLLCGEEGLELEMRSEGVHIKFIRVIRYAVCGN